MSFTFTRRRVITIMAAAAGLPLLLHARGAQARLVRWEGTALGAPASIALYHTDEAAARAAIAAGVAELERLEKVFSLYRADSALARLNAEGGLTGAPSELLDLVGQARGWAALSDGAFDPTVQPLWQLYFSHFTGAEPAASGPSDEAIEAARALVDWRAVEVDAASSSIRLGRPGMGLTLNGIAQGYITDRVCDVLRAQGLDRMLVDMGEPRALSAHPDGSAWRIGVAHPAEPAKSVTTLEVVDKGVSTSGGYGTTFDPEGRFTHLLDPRTGRTAPARSGVTVVADTAAKADALSTALAVAPVERRQAIVTAAGGVKALFVAADGSVTTLAS